MDLVRLAIIILLIECGFMTNYNDVCYLKDEQNNIVEGIFNFMVNYKTPTK